MSLGRAPGVVVLGGINMDLVTYSDRFPGAGETIAGNQFLTYAGGKGANQAVAAARMGARTAMVGRVGGDIFGPQLVDGLRAEGIDASWVSVAPGESSGIASISVDRTGQNRIIQVLGANSTCGGEQSSAVASALLGANTLMLQLEVPVEVSLSAAREARAQGKTVILDPGPVRNIPASMFHFANIITPNETEAEAIVGFQVSNRDTAARAAEALMSRGAETAVVKLGAQGAYYASAGTSGFQSAFSVRAVDTVAAGDAFNGALAVCLAEGSPLEEAVRVACAAGALAVTTTGAQDSMPTRAAVDALLASR